MLQAKQNEIERWSSVVEGLNKESKSQKAEVSRLSSVVKSEQRARKEGVESYRKQVSELKSALKEDHKAKAKLVETCNELRSKAAAIQSKYDTSVTVIETLRAKLQEAQLKVEDADKRVQEATKSLAETKKSIPSIVKEESLKQYKKVVCEQIEVPERFLPLIESAKSESDVDTVMLVQTWGRATRNLRIASLNRK
jgi:chromosome segregation ATPase